MSGIEIISASYLLRYVMCLVIFAGNMLFMFINTLPILPQNKKKIGIFIILKNFTSSLTVLYLPCVAKTAVVQDVLILLLEYGGLMLFAYLLFQYTEANLPKICLALLWSDLLAVIAMHIPMQLMLIILGYRSSNILTMPWSWKATLLLIGELVCLILVQKCMYPLYHKYREMEIKHGTFWVGIFVIYILAQMLVMLKGQSDESLGEQIQKIMVLVVLFGGAGGLYIYTDQRNQKLRREYEALKGQKRLLEKQLYEMQEQEEQLYQFQQEVEGHLRKVQSSAETDKKGEAKRYFLQLQKRYQQMSYKDYCGDMTLNALLNEKEKQAKKCGVSLYIDLSRQYAMPAVAVELIDLISQVLDWGVEECQRADAGDRNITFRCGQIRHRQIIDCIYKTAAAQKKQERGKKERNARRAYRQREESLRELVRHNGGTLQVMRSQEAEEVIIMMA